MKWILKPAILAVAPLLMAAIWMDRQPAYKPYQAPVLAPPATSVPVTGREVVSWQDEPVNPLAANAASQARGKTLYEINCAMCHGHTAAERGPVGKKLTPPPPGLEQELLRERSDSAIYKAISLGFGRMPPFRERLTPQERWHLVNFLRSRK